MESIARREYSGATRYLRSILELSRAADNDGERGTRPSARRLATFNARAMSFERNVVFSRSSEILRGGRTTALPILAMAITAAAIRQIRAAAPSEIREIQFPLFYFIRAPGVDIVYSMLNRRVARGMREIRTRGAGDACPTAESIEMNAGRSRPVSARQDRGSFP